MDIASELGPGMFGSPPDTGQTVECRVMRVLDGDTVEVEVRQRYHVRLLDCWAPEVKGESREAGLASKANLEEIVGVVGRSAVLSVPGGEDVGKSWSMGRVLGNVWIRGHELSLSEQQVAAGHARRTK